jgi:hypothetical protein
MVDSADGTVANAFDSGYDDSRRARFERMTGLASHSAIAWKGTRP